MFAFYLACELVFDLKLRFKAKPKIRNSGFQNKPDLSLS